MNSLLIMAAILIAGGSAHQKIGDCYYTAGRTEISAFGTTHYYCDYNVTEANGTTNTLSVIPGSEFRTQDCMECQCARAGMRCCAIGIKSTQSPSYIPPECHMVADGCEAVMVLRSDNKTDCYSGEPVYLAKQRKNMMMDIFRTMPMQRPFGGMGAMNGMTGMNGMGEERTSSLFKIMLLNSLFTEPADAADAPPTSAPAGQVTKPLPSTGNGMMNMFAIPNNMLGDMFMLRMLGGGEM